MTLHRHALHALVLLVGGGLLAPGEAQANRRLNVDSLLNEMEKAAFRVTIASDDISIVELSLSSDAGDEDLVLTESDAWLHGATALSALPVKAAALTLTLYDKGSASLMSFSGTLATDGTVSLTADASDAPCEVRTRTGCEVTVAYDVEILAAEVYPSGKGYVLTLDLAGADTYEVAYAAITVVESDEVTTCDRVKGCTTTGTATTTKAEVDWDAIGSVWQAESTLDHTGVIDVKAKTRDAKGKTLENVKAELAEPWEDGGAGVNALSAGAGTSVAVSRRGRLYGTGSQPVSSSDGSCRVTVVSSGWTTSEHPTHAELELAGGETVSVPANSYQRMRKRPELLYQAWDASVTEYFTDLVLDPGSTISITSGSFVMEGYSASQLSTPVCSSGTCIVLVEAEKGYALSVSSYGASPAKLADKQDFGVVFYDAKGNKVASEAISVEFDAEVTAVFASELEIGGDPTGGDASGSVRLLQKVGTTGKDDLLVTGTFFGSLSPDSDGDLGLGGYGTDEWATSESSAAVQIGDPVECGGEGCDGDWAPPVIVYGVLGTGGKVTKIVVSSGGLGYDAF